MKLKSTMLYISLFASMLFACAENTTIDPEDEIAEIETDLEVEEQVPETDSLKISSIKILALGDSYTIAEFPQLVNTAIQKAKGDKSNIIVLSIPDYAYTPFGGGNSNISTEIDAYNAFAEDYCLENNISYANITDITREGLANPALVASDGLHPSELAYSKFVDSILPIAIEKIKN